MYAAGHRSEAEEARARILAEQTRAIGVHHRGTMLLQNWQRIYLELESPQF
jgi:hypothetical protein